jgi:Phosphoglycerate kinase
VLIGGAMAYTFLKARGLEVGKSLVESDKTDLASKLEARVKEGNVILQLPVDHVVASNPDDGANARNVIEIPDGAPFLGEDPRKSRKWPAHIWNLIENSQIIPGMTAEEVKMSWGEPDKITPTATGESWLYTAGTLTFKKGTLTGRR